MATVVSIMSHEIQTNLTPPYFFFVIMVVLSLSHWTYIWNPFQYLNINFDAPVNTSFQDITLRKYLQINIFFVPLVRLWLLISVKLIFNHSVWLQSIFFSTTGGKGKRVPRDPYVITGSANFNFPFQFCLWLICIVSIWFSFG